jgi:hypothetical protein
MSWPEWTVVLVVMEAARATRGDREVAVRCSDARTLPGARSSVAVAAPSGGRGARAPELDVDAEAELGPLIYEARVALERLAEQLERRGA